MIYKILISYCSGDSNGHQDETRLLDMTWIKEEIAEINIQRIKEHHEWYENTEGNRAWRLNKKEKEKIKIPSCVSYYKGCPSISGVILLTDDGKDFIQQAFWHGHFETLYSASIKIENDKHKYVVNKRYDV